MAATEDSYNLLIKQLDALLHPSDDYISKLANTAASLKDFGDFLWVGFYLVKGNELVLGPFQGPVACTRIEKGRGVCGTAWEKESSIRVGNVHEFDGHIACSPLSNSELVVPFHVNGRIAGVLDIDSTEFDGFDELAQKKIEEAVRIMELKL